MESNAFTNVMLNPNIIDISVWLILRTLFKKGLKLSYALNAKFNASNSYVRTKSKFMG